MEFKSWQAQEYYNEYRQLKEDIRQLVNSRDYLFRKNMNKEVLEFQENIDKKVKKLKIVLQELKLSGVSMEDLLLLSIGIDF